jgi:hypothetical protein
MLNFADDWRRISFVNDVCISCGHLEHDHFANGDCLACDCAGLPKSLSTAAFKISTGFTYEEYEAFQQLRGDFSPRPMAACNPRRP